MSTQTTPPDLAAILREDEPGFLRGLRLHHLMYAILYAALFFWVVVIAGVLLVTGLLFLTGWLVVAILVIYFRRRSTQQDALLWALAIATDREMPLAPALEAFSGQCRGEYRRKVLALAHYLRIGMPLPEALVREPGVLPRDARVLVQVGWESGVLAGALREAASSRTALRPAWVLLVSRFTYFILVLWVLQAITGFIMYFIVPKFEAIFNDFGTELPALTKFLIAASHFLVVYGWPFLILEFAALGYLPVAMYGWSRWHVPFFDRVFVARHSGLILRSLARVVEGGRPFEWGVATLVKCYPTAWVRRRLRGVALDLTRGEDWCRSLYEFGLIRAADVAVLDAARRAGNLGWALRQTAEAGERRLAFRLQAWIQALFPFFVLLIGAAVFVMAVGYFSPLIRLIERLA